MTSMENIPWVWQSKQVPKHLKKEFAETAGRMAYPGDEKGHDPPKIAVAHFTDPKAPKHTIIAYFQAVSLLNRY